MSGYVSVSAIAVALCTTLSTGASRVLGSEEVGVGDRDAPRFHHIAEMVGGISNSTDVLIGIAVRDDPATQDVVENGDGSKWQWWTARIQCLHTLRGSVASGATITVRYRKPLLGSRDGSNLEFYGSAYPRFPLSPPVDQESGDSSVRTPEPQTPFKMSWETQVQALYLMGLKAPDKTGNGDGGAQFLYLGGGILVDNWPVVPRHPEAPRTEWPSLPDGAEAVRDGDP